MKKIKKNNIIDVSSDIVKDKNISEEEILIILEEGISIIMKKKCGNDISLKTLIDNKSGLVNLYQKRILSDRNDIAQQILLSFVSVERLNILLIKQIITLNIIKLEKKKLLLKFKNEVGNLLIGTVKKVKKTFLVINLKNAEAIIKKKQLLKTDFYNVGEKIKVYVLKLDQESENFLIITSRTNKNFVALLFLQITMKINKNIVIIKNIARKSGVRTKIAIYFYNSTIIYFSLHIEKIIRLVMKELKREKVDIIKWDKDISQFVSNILSEKKILKIIICKIKSKIEIVINNNQCQNIIFDKNEQDIQLSSEIIKNRIDIFNKSSEIEKRKKELTRVSKWLQIELNLQNMLVDLMIAQGFVTITSVANSNVNTLSKMTKLNKEIAIKIIKRAKKCIK